VVSCLTSIVSNVISPTIFEIFDVKVCDLDLGRFKIIQSQISRCQSIAHVWFPIQLLLTPSSYLSLLSKYLICSFSDLELVHCRSRSSRVKIHNVNRKPVDGFLSDLHCVQHHISHYFWATVCKTVRPMPSARCLSVLSCLSVTLEHCGQTVGWIKMKLGTQVGLGLGHIVLDGDPAPQRGIVPQLSAHSDVAKGLHG